MKDVNKIMETIPKEWRNRWCSSGLCACMGCVQIGNRLIMAKETTGKEYTGDPEYISEGQIPEEIYDKYKITKEEWEAWKREQPQQ